MILLLTKLTTSGVVVALVPMVACCVVMFGKNKNSTGYNYLSGISRAINLVITSDGA